MSQGLTFAQIQQPTLSVSIEQPLSTPSGTPTSYDVSNLNFINVDILINTKGEGNLDEVGSVVINPPTNNLPSSYITITAVNSSGTNIPVKAKMVSGNGTNGTNGYVVSFYIPEDSATRTSKEQAYINQIKSTDTQSPANAISWINQNNSKALAALDQIYTQSQTGAFTITVTYVSNKAGLWNGTVQSVAIIANILDEGSQFDNLQ
jgi:hypothetical protein